MDDLEKGLGSICEVGFMPFSNVLYIYISSLA